MTKKNIKVAIIITAAGASSRVGCNTKKEYLSYKKGTVLSASVETFLEASKTNFKISDFIITCRKNDFENCKKALDSLNLACVSDVFQIVEGAQTRQKSVYNALCAVKNNPEIVLIHDGARPFVSQKIILDCIAAAQNFGASVPGLTPVDTQKQIDENGFIVKHLQRSSLISVQTPQGFKFAPLLQAHKIAYNEKTEYTDDTEIWGKYCGNVRVIPGESKNIKITYPKDLEILKC